MSSCIFDKLGLVNGSTIGGHAVLENKNEDERLQKFYNLVYDLFLIKNNIWKVIIDLKFLNICEKKQLS